jgi:small conductance mechanosensitive channel
MNFNSIVNAYVIPWGINILFAIAIFVIGKAVVKAIVSVSRKIMKKTEMDDMLTNFLLSIINIVLMLFVIVAALNRLGVNTASLVALLGAAGLAIGLSLQDSLKNFAAGVMIILFKPFKLGDFVEAGGAIGIVEKITIFSTQFKTGDNKEIIVPNGSIYGGMIINYSAKETRRIDLVFGIGYEDDIKKAKEIIMDILKSDERILKEPEPTVALGELADSSVNFNVRPWVKSSDYWSVRSDILEKIKIAFDGNGISIPYPQLDIHLNKIEH